MDMIHQLRTPGAPEFSLKVATWEQNYLIAGRYVGEDITHLDFPWEPGEYVPINKRRTAMLMHTWATYATTVTNNIRRGKGAKAS